PSGYSRRKRCWRRWRDADRRKRCLALWRYSTPNVVTPDSRDIAVLRASTTILLVTYAMMESRLSTEGQHVVGRTGRGLYRSGRSGDRPATPAGPPDVSHPPVAVSARC